MKTQFRKKYVTGFYYEMKIFKCVYAYVHFLCLFFIAEKYGRVIQKRFSSKNSVLEHNLKGNRRMIGNLCLVNK